MSSARALFLLACFLLPFTGATSAPPLQEQVRFEQNLGKKLPLNSGFIDEYGQSFSFGKNLGRSPGILVFTYYRCPSLCSLVLNGLLQALKELSGISGPRFQVLVVSIDPSEKPSLALAKKRSTLARLGVTEERQDAARSSWHFLTGPEEAIRQLTSVAGFHYYRDEASGEYAHPSGMVIISPHGEISQYFFGIQFDAKKVQQALLSAVQERMGSWVDEVLLYCFHYDPRLSSNGPLVMRVIRITGAVGALGLLALLGCLFSSRRKEPGA